jgi:hypothetical protein
MAGALLITACQSDDQNSNSDNPAEPRAEQTGPATPEAPTGDDPVASPVPPPLDIPEANTLLNSPYWVAEFWVKDGKNTPESKGRWWKFEPDGTYTTGLWQDQIASGVWALTDDQGKILLHLDANVAGLNEEFHLQGTSQGGGYMSWVGTRLYGMNTVAVKSISLLSKPTRAQFGVE